MLLRKRILVNILIIVSHFIYSVKKNKFINLQKFTESSAIILTETDLNTDLIETLRIQVNDQILTLHDSHYSLNTVTNLIFFEMLEQQEFEIKKIRKSDDLYLFKITDLENQVFTVIKYSIDSFRFSLVLKTDTDF